MTTNKREVRILLDILKKMHKYAQKSISYATDAFINGNIDSRGNLMDTEEKIHETQQKNYI